MSVLKKKIVVNMQCFLWIALLLFTTVACSAKRSFLVHADLSVERPLNVNKALGSVVVTSCDTPLGNQHLVESTQDVDLDKLLYSDADTKASTAFVHLINLEKGQADYILHVAGTDPPKYLLYKQFKLAIV